MLTKRHAGFSLLETLICIAIISILMALYLPVLSKAKRKAEEVAIKEGFHQRDLARQADNANSVRRRGEGYGRAECQAAFRQKMSDGSGDGEIIFTELLYNVSNEAEFRAYWHTLIDPDNTVPLTYSGGNLIAKDEDGNEFSLKPITNGRFAWEFLSTNLSETSSGTPGTTVLYPDGHTEYIVYPKAFPAVPVVAELSHRFVVETS